MDFGWVLGPFGAPFWSLLGAQDRPRRDQEGPSWLQNAPRRRFFIEIADFHTKYSFPKNTCFFSSKEVAGNCLRQAQHVSNRVLSRYLVDVNICDRFWTDFHTFLGSHESPLGAPRRTQNRSNIDLNMILRKNRWDGIKRHSGSTQDRSEARHRGSWEPPQGHPGGAP